MALRTAPPPPPLPLHAGKGGGKRTAPPPPPLPLPWWHAGKGGGKWQRRWHAGKGGGKTKKGKGERRRQGKGSMKRHKQRQKVKKREKAQAAKAKGKGDATNGGSSMETPPMETPPMETPPVETAKEWRLTCQRERKQQRGPSVPEGLAKAMRVRRLAQMALKMEARPWPSTFWTAQHVLDWRQGGGEGGMKMVDRIERAGNKMRSFPWTQAEDDIWTWEQARQRAMHKLLAESPSGADGIYTSVLLDAVAPTSDAFERMRDFYEGFLPSFKYRCWVPCV